MIYIGHSKVNYIYFARNVECMDARTNFIRQCKFLAKKQHNLKAYA